MSEIIGHTCDFNLAVGASPVIDFVAGVIELVFLGYAIIIFRPIPYFWPKGSKTGAVVIAPIYFLVMFYAMSLSLILGISAIAGLTYEFIEADFVKWVLFRTCTEGLAVFFLHNGIGQRALRHAICGGIAWGLISGGIPFIIYYFSDGNDNYNSEDNNFDSFMIATLCFSALLFVFYFVCWISPVSYFHRRPAMITFSLLNMFIVSLTISATSLMLLNGNSTDCGVEIILAFCYDLQPFVILYAIRQDSMFWQGLFQSSGANLNEPLLGVWEIGRDTMTIFADTINHLERKVVPIIPFTQLQVDTSKFFSGGTARVYRGQFNNKLVAIKFAFSIELTPETVLSFRAEASMLNSLQHPNVVKCFGVAVMPPALCLVTEFCHFGSLYDFLHALDLVVRESRASNQSAGSARLDGSSVSGPHGNRNTDDSGKLVDPEIGRSLSQSSAPGGASTNRLTWQSSVSSGSSGSGGSSGHRNSNLHFMESCDSLPVRGGSFSVLGHSHLSSHLSETESVTSDRRSMSRSQSMSSYLEAATQAASKSNRSSEAEGDDSNSMCVPSLAAPLNSLKNTNANINANTESSSNSTISGPAKLLANLRSGRQSSIPSSSVAAVGDSVSSPMFRLQQSATSDISESTVASPSSPTSSSVSIAGVGQPVIINEAKVLDISRVNLAGNRTRTISNSSNSSNSNSNINHNNTNLSGSNNVFVVGFDRSSDSSEHQKPSAISASQQSMNSTSLSGEYIQKLAEIFVKRQDRYSDDNSSTHSAMSATTLERLGFSVGPLRSSKDSVDSTSGAVSGAIGGKRGSNNRRSSNNNNNNNNSSSVPSSMKSLANVMTSQEMGFGLGPKAAKDKRRSINRRGTESSARGGTEGSRGYHSGASAGSLLATVRKSRFSLGSTLPLSLRMSMARDAAAGVAYLHQNGLLHCDIKSLNFLVTQDLVVKLADLGEARSDQIRRSQVGQIPRNINWTSPEALRDGQSISRSADVWSLALVLSEIFSGEIPFDSPEIRDLSFEEFQDRIAEGMRPEIPKRILEVFPWLSDMMAKAWALEPSDRSTADEILLTIDKYMFESRRRTSSQL